MPLSRSGVAATFIVLCAVSVTARAANETLDWPRCVADAQSQNPDVAAARHAESAAQARADQSRSAFLPQVSATVDTNRSASDSGTASQTTAPRLGAATSLEPLAAADSWRYTDQFSYGVAVKQSLFSGFKDQATVKRREAEVEGAEAAIRQSRVELAFNLRSAFIQQLYAQELVELQRQVAKRRRENVRLVELRFEGGRENKGSLLKSRATQKQADLDVAAAERSLTVAQAQLARVLGRQLSAATRVHGIFGVHPVPTVADLAAVAHSVPAVQQAAAAVRAAAYTTDATRAASYPEIAATASAARAGDHWPPDGNRLSVGLNLSMPLYTGGSLKADERAAEADHARSQAALASAESQAYATLVDARAGMEDAVARVAVQADVKEAAVLQEEIARNQYALGLLSFQEWDLIENGLNDADQRVLATRKDAATAYATLSRALGQTLAEAKEP